MRYLFLQLSARSAVIPATDHLRAAAVRFVSVEKEREKEKAQDVSWFPVQWSSIQPHALVEQSSPLHPPAASAARILARASIGEGAVRPA
jgi:hypothetical protein